MLKFEPGNRQVVTAQFSVGNINGVAHPVRANYILVIKMIIKLKKEWKNLVGRHAELISVSEKPIPTLTDYIEGQLKSYSHLYKDLTEEQFRIKYNEYIDYLEKFNGICKLNEQVEIHNTDRPDVILLTKKWRGGVSFNSDLEVWLWKELEIPKFKKILKCEFYSFYTVHVAKNDPIAFLEGAGTSIHSWPYGIYQVTFDDYLHPNLIEFTKLKGIGGTNRASFKII